MEVVTFENCLKEKLKIDTLCLGSFDGFHLGHQDLLLEAILNSKGSVGVLLFSSHPDTFFKKSFKELMPLEEKVHFLTKFKIDYAVVISTDSDFYSLPYVDFINKFLKKINPNKIVVGEDFRFGYQALGKPSDLSNYFEVEVVKLKTINDEKISSSTIRELILKGKLEEANNLLGYNYQIKGKVIEGLHNGTNFGFPTANINLPDGKLCPQNGVYAALTYINGIPYKSMVNIGTHPTIDEINNPIIEVHIIDFQGNLYNKTLYVEFVKEIRREKKFANVSELINQLNKDKAEVNKILSY